MTSRKTVWARSDTSLKTLREELLNGESFYKIVHASIGYKLLAPELFVAGFAIPTGFVGHAGRNGLTFHLDRSAGLIKACRR